MAGDSGITVTTLTKNELSTWAQSVQYASSTGANIYVDLDTMDASQVLLCFKQTAGGAVTLNILDGDHYSGGDIGNVQLVSTALGEYIFGPFETSRFKDSDGYINIQAATTGDTALINIRAILLP